MRYPLWGVLMLILMLIPILTVGRLQVDPSPTIETAEELYQATSKAYAGITDLNALITIRRPLLPIESAPEQEIQLRIMMIWGERVIRVEYIKPNLLRGQIYTLDGDLFSQYLPLNRTIIRTRLSERELPLDPNLLFELPDPEGFGLSMDRTEGFFILRAVPKQGSGFEFEEQRIWISATDLLPRKMVSTIIEEFRGESRKVAITTTIDELMINQGLTKEGLLALPEDAQIIEG